MCLTCAFVLFKDMRDELWFKTCNTFLFFRKTLLDLMCHMCIIYSFFSILCISLNLKISSEIISSEVINIIKLARFYVISLGEICNVFAQTSS